MADSFTPNLNLDKPEVGAANNLWGGSLNSDLDIVDSIFTATSTMMVSMVLKSDSSIADVTTTSKRMLFNLAGISTSTTRNLTVQDADGTLAYTAQVAASTVGLGTVTTGQVAAATVGMVDTTSSQILTNKTLTAPLLTGILAASTGVTTTAGDNSAKLATTAYVDTTRLPGARTRSLSPARGPEQAMRRTSGRLRLLMASGRSRRSSLAGTITLNNGGGVVAVKLDRTARSLLDPRRQGSNVGRGVQVIRRHQSQRQALSRPRQAACE